MSILKSPAMDELRVPLRPQPAPVAQPAGPSQPAPRSDAQEEEKLRLKAEHDAAVERGYKEGFEAGHAEGREMGAEALNQQAATLAAAAGAVDTAWAGWLDGAESTASDLAFQAVCQILGHAAVKPEAVAGVVRQLMRPLREADVLCIRLHPAELQSLRESLEREGDASPLARVADRLVADAELATGGCVIDTPRGDYRGSFDVQLRRLRQLLDDRRSDVLFDGEIVDEEARRA
ncbi:MAG: hypothetical protein EPO12_04520 [Aquabacterium sp.]|nr:MAG: hypothetical protein EPO12_04520 [Aquabacterium sp.]